MVVHVVRDEVYIPPPEIAPSGAGGGGFNPFAMSIPLAFAGAVLVILFPPVGLMLFALAAVTMGWGVLSVLLSRR